MAEEPNRTKVVSEEVEVFEDDQEYVDSYSAIISNLIEHYTLWQCMREGRLRKGGVRNKENEECARQMLPELNKALQVQEWLFWEKVDQSLKAGKTFFLEDFAEHYRLGHFEKRVFLLCLYSELSGEEGFSISIPAIINMLNLDNSVIGKVKNIAHLNKEMPLLKQGILAPIHKLDTRNYKINGVFLEFISKRLNGNMVEWPKFEQAEAADPDGPESVGFVKNPEQSLDNVILKDDVKEKVRFFLDVYKSDKFHELGVDKTIKNSKGLTFLFYGPPGTGKTMLAEAIAHNAGKKLLVAETPKIFNMWLGETDKKIHAMFKVARENDLVLLIDEADSLIYSRELASSDLKLRFVNLMLTELERFEGVAILTTNMDQVLDNALERRIALKVQFELPSCERRSQIWKNHIPPAFDLAATVDIDELSRKYQFSGGNIKNAVLTAIRRAIFRTDKLLTMEDLVFGADVEREGMLSVKNGPKVIKGFSV